MEAEETSADCELLCVQRVGSDLQGSRNRAAKRLVAKGGIHERGGRSKWSTASSGCFPRDSIRIRRRFAPEARPLLQEVANEAPSPACVRLSLYAVVDEVYELTDASLLPRLAGLQILADDTLLERFHYRRPALFVLTVRIYRQAEPIALAESPHFAGCRTWVDLEHDLTTDGLVPVMGDAAHNQRVIAVRSAFVHPAT